MSLCGNQTSGSAACFAVEKVTVQITRMKRVAVSGGLFTCKCCSRPMRSARFPAQSVSGLLHYGLIPGRTTMKVLLFSDLTADLCVYRRLEWFSLLKKTGKIQVVILQVYVTLRPIGFIIFSCVCGTHVLVTHHNWLMNWCFCIHFFFEISRIVV